MLHAYHYHAIYQQAGDPNVAHIDGVCILQDKVLGYGRYTKLKEYIVQSANDVGHKFDVNRLIVTSLSYLGETS